MYCQFVRLVGCSTRKATELAFQHARRSLSTVGGTHVCPPNREERSTASRVANQPPHTSHYCPPLIHLHSPPPAGTV